MGCVSCSGCYRIVMQFVAPRLCQTAPFFMVVLEAYLCRSVVLFSRILYNYYRADPTKKPVGTGSAHDGYVRSFRYFGRERAVANSVKSMVLSVVGLLEWVHL